MSTHSQMATDVCFSSRYLPPTPSYAMADACWAQLLTYDHHIIFDTKYVFLDMTIRSWCLSRNPWCWSHNYVFWTEVIGFDNTFLDFRWKSLIVTILQWFLSDNRWFWQYCNSFWREIIYFDNTCTTFVQKSMILTILSWFLLKKCNFDNTVLFLIRNQAFWTYCRAFWCLSVWPECSAGDLSLARMTSHRALWPDRRENARGYPQNAWFPINKQASMLKIDDFLSKIFTVLSKSMHSGQKWWQYRRNQGFVFKSHHSMVTNWFTINDVGKKYKSISETDALCSNTMIAWSTAMILLKNHNLMDVFEK